MTRLLFDTSILLDVLLRREPWVTEAATLWQMHVAGRVEGHLSAVSLTNVFYIVRRAADLKVARQSVQVCLGTFLVIPVDEQILLDADAMPGSDFEDNVQIACAVAAGLDAIVTRDPAGFAVAPLPA